MDASGAVWQENLSSSCKSTYVWHNGAFGSWFWLKLQHDRQNKMVRCVVLLPLWRVTTIMYENSFLFSFLLRGQVLANMNAAYKQEKKNAKRKAHSMSPVTFKVSDPLFTSADAPSLKKVKEESLYLSFPVETVLATEQSSSGDVKTELVYHLAESVNWGAEDVLTLGNDRRGRCCWRSRQWKAPWPQEIPGNSSRIQPHVFLSFLFHSFPLRTVLFLLKVMLSYFHFGLSIKLQYFTNKVLFHLCNLDVQLFLELDQFISRPLLSTDIKCLLICCYWLL